MQVEGDASAAYRREIETADNPQAARVRIEAQLPAITSPFRTAEATGQEIIGPRDTRPLLCDFVTEAQAILYSKVGPGPNPYAPITALSVVASFACLGQQIARYPELTYTSHHLTSTVERPRWSTETQTRSAPMRLL